MRLTAKTRALAIVAALLLALVLVTSGQRASVADVPRIEAVTRDAVTRIELSGAEDKLVIRPEAGRWRVTAPFQAEADQQAVQALLTAFRKEIPIDVAVDRGNEDKYGLEPGKGHVVEVWTSEEDPVISFTVGDDAAGGSSYIRLSGDDAVYRARVGGRARFAKPQAEWRSRFVLDLAPERVVGMTFRAGEAELALTRPAAETSPEGVARARPWSLEPAPPWAVDQALADAWSARLAQLRAVAILPPDTTIGPAAAEVQLSLDDGSARTLRLHPREDGPLLATVDEAPERYRVPDALLQILPKTADDLRDRTVLRLVREDIDTLLYEDAAGQILLRQDAASQVWQPIQPAGLALDVRQTQVAANILALLRAEAVIEGAPGPESGLQSPTLKITITRVDGTTARLMIGAATTDALGRAVWYATSEGNANTFLVADELVSRLKAGFGRS